MAITKVINSESQAYRPVLTDTLVLDAVPTVNSFNSVTSDAVARAVAGASGEVPQVTENDNGKVLKAIYDAGGPAVEWGEAPNAVPAVGENDNAKVLTATYSEGTGSYAWATPSGGESSYSAGEGIAISVDTISAKVDGTTLTNNKSSVSQSGIASSKAVFIQNSCDNASSLLIGPANYDYSTEAWFLDWTLSFWRNGSEPQNAGFYRIDLKSDSTWVLPSGWYYRLEGQQVKLYAASTDGTTMSTPIALPLYKEPSTDSANRIVYSASQGTTLPRYVYVYVTDADVAAFRTCNTLNFGVDRYGSDTTMLTAKPTDATLGTYMDWICYVQITGQLGLYDSGSNEYDVRIPKSYKGNIAWSPMYDVLQIVRNVSVSAGNVATFYLDYNTSYGGTDYKIPDTWGVGVFFIDLLISDQSGVAPTKGWNVQVSYSDNDGNTYELYRQAIPADRKSVV